MKFSDKIVFMRKKRGISQERLAKKMGVSRQTIYKWEADLNTPEFNKIERLAEILEISYDLLLDDSIDLNKHFNDEESIVSNKSVDAVPMNTDAPPQSNEQIRKISKGAIILILSVVLLTVILTVSAAFIIRELLNDGTDDSSSISLDSSSDNAKENLGVDTSSPLIPDMNDTVCVQFDARGGEITESYRIFSCNEKIGELPVPKKDGFLFSYWETEGSVKVGADTVIDTDITLYAVYENISDTITIKLNANGGSVGKSELRLEKNSAIYDYLPIPTHNDSLRFLGWFDKNGVKVVKGTRYSSNQELTAYWNKLDFCLNLNGLHVFDSWDNSHIEPDCENDGFALRTCIYCHYEEIRIEQTALGHSYEIISYGDLCDERECTRCGLKKVVQYININDSCIGNTMITGNVEGKEYYYAVFDGYFDNHVGPGCAENEEMIIDIYLKEYTYIDCIFTQGWGNMDFEISVISPPVEEFQVIGQGSFQEESQVFIVKSYVRAIRVYTDNADGYWQEIALAQIAKEEK